MGPVEQLSGGQGLGLHWGTLAQLGCRPANAKLRGFSYFSYTEFFFHVPRSPMPYLLAPLPTTTLKKTKGKKYSVLRKVRASLCSLLGYVIISSSFQVIQCLRACSRSVPKLCEASVIADMDGEDETQRG